MRAKHTAGGAYRGYLITCSFATGMYYVSKDGAHVFTAKSLEEAKETIDKLLEGPGEGA